VNRVNTSTSPAYRLSGYTEAGRWAEETTDEAGLRRARAGQPVGAVHTWVAVERLDQGEWVHLD
jgi:hypothetical protein